MKTVYSRKRFRTIVRYFFIFFAMAINAYFCFRIKSFAFRDLGTVQKNVFILSLLLVLFDEPLFFLTSLHPTLLVSVI